MSRFLVEQKRSLAQHLNTLTLPQDVYDRAWLAISHMRLAAEANNAPEVIRWGMLINAIIPRPLWHG